MPTNEATTNPARVNASTAAEKRGSGGTSGGSGSVAGMEGSPAKNSRNATYSTAITASQGRAIRPAKLTKVSPAADMASRLVRFDTGSSHEPALARCVQA